MNITHLPLKAARSAKVIDLPVLYHSMAFECRIAEDGSVRGEIYEAQRFSANLEHMLDQFFAKYMPMVEFAKTWPAQRPTKRTRNSVGIDCHQNASLHFIVGDPASVTNFAMVESEMRQVAELLIHGARRST